MNMKTMLVIACATAFMLSSLPALASQWHESVREEVVSLNSDIRHGVPTVDVGMYYPSNGDPAFRAQLDEAEMLAQFKKAKETFLAAGVQLNLLWLKTGPVDQRHFAILANEPGSVMPDSNFVSMYENGRRNPTLPTVAAIDAFEAIVEPHPDNDRTIYILALPRVFMSFAEQEDERTWTVKTIRTGGLSFPSYNYSGMPRRVRGVVTVSREDENKKVIAHEVGHKILNVSHEHGDVPPQHEVRSDEGLMVYGIGTQIGSGEAGRWHRERLHLSPFVYRVDASGERVWNPDYREGGHYFDPIYGKYVITADLQ